MRVVDVRDFCVPSDDNDYDELVAFADTMASIPQFDAIPIEVLDKIKAELHLTAEMHEDGDYYLREEWIDEIFDKYKAESDGKE